MKKTKHWVKSVLLDYPYWRVTYSDGRRTVALYYKEAKALSKIYNAKLWIDYSLPNY